MLKHNINYFETSAKVKHNIKEVFIAIAQDILQSREKLKEKTDDFHMDNIQSKGRKTLQNKKQESKEEKPCCS